MSDPFEALANWEPPTEPRHAPDPECSGVPEECECGPPLLQPLTGFDLFMIQKYGGGAPTP